MGSPRSAPGAAGKLYADKGYDADDLCAECRRRSIAPRIVHRGIESSERLGRWRWKIERTLSWAMDAAGWPAAMNVAPAASPASSRSRPRSFASGDSPNETPSELRMAEDIPDHHDVYRLGFQEGRAGVPECVGVAPADNSIRSGQATCSYSRKMPPKRSRLRTSSRAIRSGVVTWAGSGWSGRAFAMP